MVACLQGKMLYVQRRRLKLFNRGLIIAGCRVLGREMKNGMQTRRDESQIASLPSATWNALHFNSLYFIALSDIENPSGIHFCFVDVLLIVFDVMQGVWKGVCYVILSKFLFSIQNIIFENMGGSPTPASTPSEIPHKSFYKACSSGIYFLQFAGERREDSRYVSIKWHHSAFVWKFKLRKSVCKQGRLSSVIKKAKRS